MQYGRFFCYYFVSQFFSFFFDDNEKAAKKIHNKNKDVEEEQRKKICIKREVTSVDDRNCYYVKQYNGSFIKLCSQCYSTFIPNTT